jgi:hypothetical protein
VFWLQRRETPAADQAQARLQSIRGRAESGRVWVTKKKKCLPKHSGALPDADLGEYANALAKADRFQEVIDGLDLLQDPNTPRALNQRAYAAGPINSAT